MKLAWTISMNISYMSIISCLISNYSLISIKIWGDETGKVDKNWLQKSVICTHPDRKQRDFNALLIH